MAADSTEELVTQRVEDHAEHWLLVDDEADADCEERDTVGIVDGPIERIDDPGARRQRARATRFLGQERVAREGLSDLRQDGLLAEMIDLGDDVLLALVHDPLEAFVAVHLDRPATRAAAIATASSSANSVAGMTRS